MADLARVAKTRARDSGPLTQAACPALVAILPSRVMAYFRTEKGRPVAALWSSACSRAT